MAEGNSAKPGSGSTTEKIGVGGVLEIDPSNESPFVASGSNPLDGDRRTHRTFTKKEPLGSSRPIHGLNDNNINVVVYSRSMDEGKSRNFAMEAKLVASYSLSKLAHPTTFVDKKTR